MPWCIESVSTTEGMIAVNFAPSALFEPNVIPRPMTGPRSARSVLFGAAL